jgi:hypothetical protein
MNVKRLWCRICTRVVEAVVEESGTAILAPLIGAVAGGAAASVKGGRGSTIGGALAGLLAGAAVRALVPATQRLVCRDCGTHVA